LAWANLVIMVEIPPRIEDLSMLYMSTSVIKSSLTLKYSGEAYHAKPARLK